MLQYSSLQPGSGEKFCNRTNDYCLSAMRFDQGLGALLHSIRKFDRHRPIVVLLALFGLHDQPAVDELGAYSNEDVCHTRQCTSLRTRFAPLTFRRIGALSAANASSQWCRRSARADRGKASPRSAMLSKVGVWTMNGARNTHLEATHTVSK